MRAREREERPCVVGGVCGCVGCLCGYVCVCVLCLCLWVVVVGYACALPDLEAIPQLRVVAWGFASNIASLATTLPPSHINRGVSYKVVLARLAVTITGGIKTT